MRVESEVKESISLDESSSSTTASSSGSTTNNNNTDADVSKPKGTVEKQVVAGSTTLIVKEEKEEDDDDNNSNNLFSITDFHNNDNKILAVLNEAGSNYSFRGLMRKLNLHQQSLSRALHRLEEMGIVEKSPAGYRLASVRTTSSSTTITAGAGALVIAKEELQRPKGREYTQLLQTYIPVSVRASEIVRLLIGKWFKNLRWLGMIERSGTGYTLQWASEDGSFHINVRMISDYIIIETNASTEREKMQAMIGSYAIYEQITKAVQSRLGTYSLDQSHHISTRNNN